MPTLTIAPLATPLSITERAKNAILGASHLFLQTTQHPSAQWVLDSNIPFESMDDLFDRSLDFDELNRRIADRVVCGENAVYAMPGRGAGAAQLSAILASANNAGIELEILPSSGFGEAAMAILPIATDTSHLLMCAANSLPATLDPYIPLCVEELDTRLRAGEVKLTLSEYFPQAHTVHIINMDNSGIYRSDEIPLYELDRQPSYSSSTVLYVEAVPFDKLERYGVEQLVEVLIRLRAPGGCPWDAEQTHSTLRSALIEETYEVLDAIERDDSDALCEELGDLLLQIAFHTYIEQERAEFTLRDVASGIVKKLIYRHPHVFGSVQVSNANDVLFNWEQLKKLEKNIKTQSEAMHAIPSGLPALMRSAKVQKKAADVGFDWDNAADAIAKIHEEADELYEAINSDSIDAVSEELGDLLFSAVNVARLLKRDPELTLRAATDKFIARFELMERTIIASGHSPANMTLAEMDVFWEKAKH
ncbi:MAG: nucleoside triphosphate pyrophosphohydrolase [Clostridia bacterium]